MGKLENVLPIDTQPIRAQRSGVSVRTQKKLDTVARERPDLKEKIVKGQLSADAAPNCGICAVEMKASRAAAERRRNGSQVRDNPTIGSTGPMVVERQKAVELAMCSPEIKSALTRPYRERIMKKAKKTNSEYGYGGCDCYHCVGGYNRSPPNGDDLCYNDCPVGHCDCPPTKESAAVIRREEKRDVTAQIRWIEQKYPTRFRGGAPTNTDAAVAAYDTFWRKRHKALHEADKTSEPSAETQAACGIMRRLSGSERLSCEGDDEVRSTRTGSR
jgi:hypothetical protein